MSDVFGSVVTHPYSNRGAVYIELALSLGVILSLFVASTDLASILDTRGRMSVLTRETANDVFKNCNNEAELPRCLQQVRKRNFEFARLMGLASNSLPDAHDPTLIPTDVPRDSNFEIVLSYYSCTSFTCSGDCSATSGANSCACQCVGPRLITTIPDPGASDPLLGPQFLSHYTPQIVTDKLINTMNGRGRIVISEVILRNQGLTSLTDQKVVYEESIF